MSASGSFLLAVSIYVSFSLAHIMYLSHELETAKLGFGGCNLIFRSNIYLDVGIMAGNTFASL